VYEGANHGFHNGMALRYEDFAAKVMRKRTPDFFNGFFRI
jgi:dienelactone hydrolase